MHTLTKSVLSLSVAAGLLAMALASGDAGEGGGSSSSAATADGFTEVKKLRGYQIKVPEDAKPNRGAAGFHTDDDRLSIMLRESKTQKSMADAKKSAEELFFEGWLSEETLEDGFVLTWKSVTVDMEGNKNPAFAFQVSRTFDGKQVKCSGSLKSEAALSEAVEACKTLRKS